MINCINRSVAWQRNSMIFFSTETNIFFRTNSAIYKRCISDRVISSIRYRAALINSIQFLSTEHKYIFHNKLRHLSSLHFSLYDFLHQILRRFDSVLIADHCDDAGLEVASLGDGDSEMMDNRIKKEIRPPLQ